MTIGEDRVRVKFNPSATSLVDRIKQRAAALIDLCSEEAVATSDAETIRHWRLAMTEFESAAMWAVKAATAGK